MPEYQHLDISKLLHCGCYALLRKGEVIYVGKSTKPIVRLYTHCKNRGKPMGRTMTGGYRGPTLNDKGINFDGAWFWPCMLGQLGIIETFLIRKYVPMYNMVGKPGPVIPIPEDIKELLKQVVIITDLPAPEPTAPRGPYIMRRL